MSLNRAFWIGIGILLLQSCSSSKMLPYAPTNKIAPEKLEKDFKVFRGVLENFHPSIYWFTPKDSMDYYFNEAHAKLKDSLTEVEFKKILTYVIEKLHCGHTAIRYSNNYSNYLDTANIPVFPFSIKAWGDSLVVLNNLHRSDKYIKRGTIITAIDGKSSKQLIDTFFHYLVTDGAALNGKYQQLSSRGNFGSLYKQVYGLKPSFSVQYLDANKVEHRVEVPWYDPKLDTGVAQNRRPPAGAGQRNLPPLNGIRNLQIDTSLKTGYLTINSFAKGNSLRSFFKESFKVLDERGIQDLVIDVRSNGGGDAGLSTLLTQYIIDKPFKIADTLYAVARNGEYSKHIRRFFWYRLGLLLITHKASDGKYHFGFFERHVYHPKTKHHFKGNIYILIGGNSFSATTIFARKVQGQSNITLIGETTGGGAYGNSAWMIPDVKLPNSKLYFRLPLFHLVMDSDPKLLGQGVVPDISVPFNSSQMHQAGDPRVNAVRNLILSKRNKLN
ncbi:MULTISPECIES: S41 family peptidase [unclassified Paraflavitalea]|uniref:S41 family peptidase n=1 Tax=unclassified Paraflavitalea TaxID=2798305 RepID=UPI003D32B99C